MKQNRLIALVLSTIIAMSFMGIIALAQQEGLRIEAPSEVISGEKFKIVVTYEGEPAYNAHITFEGAVVDPARTSQNGVAIITAPNVTKPTKVTMNVKYHKYEDHYDYATINVIPNKEIREKEMREKSTTLFKGEIRIAANEYWTGNYNLNQNEALLISIKTDGKVIHEYVLDADAYSNYLRTKRVREGDHYLFNVVEGEALFEAPSAGEWYLVLENPNTAIVSVSLEINRTTMQISRTTTP